jgi:hypothetical protein
MFSKRPDVRASAKLDLNAKLEYHKFQQVQQQGADVLAIVVSEARLTASEVLAILFPKQRDKEAVCVRCETAVNVQSTIYHRKCDVITWLTKYQPFTYEEVEQTLISVKRAYVSPDTRWRVSTILTLYHKLHNDIVIKTDREVVVWQRDGEGGLHKKPIRTMRDDEVVGTHAWKVKHGFSPNRASSSRLNFNTNQEFGADQITKSLTIKLIL